MDEQEALKAATEWQAELTNKKFEQETQRDKTLVLISGGALTATFAFIATFMEHHPLTRLHLLFFAWGSWTLVLVTTIVGYSLSISAYDQAIMRLSLGRWKEAQNPPRAAAWVEPVNLATCVFAIAGFALFGYFAFANLSEASDAQRKEQEVKAKEQAEKKNRDGLGDRRTAEGTKEGGGTEIPKESDRAKAQRQLPSSGAVADAPPK